MTSASERAYLTIRDMIARGELKAGDPLIARERIKELNPDVETLFMMTAQNLYFVSATMVKELFHYGGDISAYVPPAVVQRLKDKIPQNLPKT